MHIRLTPFRKSPHGINERQQSELGGERLKATVPGTRSQRELKLRAGDRAGKWNAKIPRILQMTKKTQKKTAKCNETLGATCHFVCVYERVGCLYTCVCTNLVKNWSADMPTGKWIKQKK